VTSPPDRARLRVLRSDELTEAEVRDLRALMDTAFADDEDGAFTDHDWQHALGGRHFVLDLDGEIVAHAAVVRREIEVGGRPLSTGYVEAVATTPERQGTGLGTRVMREVGSHIAAGYQLGVLGTGSHHFYERLGWRTWRGPSFVRERGRERPTPDDDGYLMVLLTDASPHLEFTERISCEWRPGDVW
jgi:aminoglycoside 2'-N-acetyltransferase I